MCGCWRDAAAIFPFVFGNCVLATVAVVVAVVVAAVAVAAVAAFSPDTVKAADLGR